MSKRILLAEDDEDNRTLVSFILRRSRLDVELLLAEDGKTAVQMAADKNPHLILMDMQMPVMDGWTAVKELKSNEKTKQIPIIAFTAQARKEDRDRSFEIGCVGYCSKPMDPAELVELIQKHIAA